jgi:hypothetical protein
LPFRKNQLLVANDAVLDDVDFSRLRNLPEQDIGPDPARAPGGRSQRLPLLNDITDEEVLRDDQQIDDRKRLQIVGMSRSLLN